MRSHPTSHPAVHRAVLPPYRPKPAVHRQELVNPWVKRAVHLLYILTNTEQRRRTPTYSRLNRQEPEPAPYPTDTVPTLYVIDATAPYTKRNLIGRCITCRTPSTLTSIRTLLLNVGVHWLLNRPDVAEPSRTVRTVARCTELYPRTGTAGLHRLGHSGRCG